MMPSLDDVAALALRLPGAVETLSRSHRQWRALGRNFAWERPYTMADIGRDGPPPPGELLGIRVSDEGEKAALLAAEPAWLTTISHFTGHPMLLVRLDEVPPDRLAELIEDAWLAVGGAGRSA